MIKNTMPGRATLGKENKPPSSRATGTGVAAAEIALKAHALCDAETMAGADNGAETLREISYAINLTEAPEDAVCSLIH